MSASRGPTVRHRRLAAELRRLREQCGLTGDEVAERLTWSTAKVSRLENARTGARPEDVRRLLELYEVNGPRQGELIELAAGATQRGWWEDFTGIPPDYATYIALEADAVACRSWDTQVIPGLLQTEAYAREIIAAWNVVDTVPPAEIERRVQVRLRRQELLHGPAPLELSVVLDEAVLHRLIGDASIMRAQLDHLFEVTRLPNVSLCVLPLNKAHSLIAESFILMEFSPAHDVTFPDVVHVESLTASHFEDETVTHMYRLTFNELAAQALGRDESRDVIAAARDRW
jgi:transcriptional regulator with XRE-family HTH domain